MMKKLLLITLGFGLAASASAQSLNGKYSKAFATKIKNEITANDVNLSISTIPYFNRLKPKSNATPNFALNLIPLGSSTNAYGISVALNCVIADPLSNMVVFGHRGSVSGNTTEIDFSTDGGSTFTNNVLANPGATNNRYPSTSLENTTGSTSASDVRYSIFTSANTGQLEGSWASAGQVTSIVASAVTTNYTTFKGYIPFSLNKGKSGDFWALNVDRYPIGVDTFDIKLQKGTFDAGLNKYVWTEKLLAVPFDFSFDSTVYSSTENAIAFDPSGNIGWIAIQGDFLDSDTSKVYDIAMYKTTDGGATWASPIFCNLNNYSEITSEVDPGIANGVATLAGNGSSFNIAVDKNGNPHVSALVFGGTAGSYGYFPTARKLLFDIYYNGSVFKPILIDSVLANSFVGNAAVDISPTFAIGNNLRNQVSRSADGSKIVFVWADTPPSSGTGNTFPDLKMKGVNISNSTVTPIINITEGTDADGVSFLSNISPILLNTATGIEVPVVIANITGPDTGPLGHLYLKGVTADLTDFTISEPRYDLGVGISNVQNDLFTVSNNFPNPFSGVSQVNVNLERSLNVSMTITNVLGQTISEKSQNMSAGVNTLQIDATNLTSGIYFYTINAGGFNVTNKMIVR